MDTIELNPTIELAKEGTTTKPYSIYKKFMAFAESQDKNRTAWFLVSILGPGVLFLPVPAALMYYYNAPIWTLAATVLLFFASVIAGMGGSKTSVLIALLSLNIIVHILQILIYVL